MLCKGWEYPYRLVSDDRSLKSATSEALCYLSVTVACVVLNSRVS